MDSLEERGPGTRARRAVPIIAFAVAAILVAGVLYLRPASPATTTNPTPRGAWTLEPADQVAYDFVSPAVGWAAVARTEPGRVAYWLFATFDGAHHWQLQHAASVDGSEASVELHLFDRRHGYAFLSRQALVATSDGGATWRPVAIPARLGYRLSFSDPDHAWLAASDDVATASGPHRFYATRDGGRSWSPLPAPPGGGFVFRGSSEGWTADGRRVFSTNDGGITWTPRSLPSGAPAPTVIRFLGADGVLTANDGLAFTSFDGGASWRMVAAPPDARFFDVAFEDATHWWAMPSGGLFKTADGGATWTHVSVQFDDWQYRVQVVDNSHAWARLDAASGIQDPLRGTALAYTRDGGVHWDYAAVPSPPA